MKQQHRTHPHSFMPVHTVDFNTTTARVCISLVAVTLILPLYAVVALPFLFALTAHHAVAIAKTAGSPTLFILLAGVDIGMIVIVLHLFIATR